MGQELHPRERRKRRHQSKGSTKAVGNDRSDETGNGESHIGNAGMAPTEQELPPARSADVFPSKSQLIRERRERCNGERNEGVGRLRRSGPFCSRSTIATPGRTSRSTTRFIEANPFGGAERASREGEMRESDDQCDDRDRPDRRLTITKPGRTSRIPFRPIKQWGGRRRRPVWRTHCSWIHAIAWSATSIRRTV
jgi:hypothetical protein